MPTPLRCSSWERRVQTGAEGRDVFEWVSVFPWRIHCPGANCQGRVQAVQKLGPAVIATPALWACATQPIPEAGDVPRFFSGYWHRLTILFALTGHLFDNSIRVYAFPNSGGWYGFVLFLVQPQPFGAERPPHLGSRTESKEH